MSIERAIQAVHGLSQLARSLGVSPQAVNKWRKGLVPEDRCLAIELATRGQVKCEDLRPDLLWTRGADGSITASRTYFPTPPAKEAA